ncbi:MAG: hypothetical protein IH827_08645 [Myxococcales bacterium]|nr:hypothetical protein [Myxococcales bacterium]
MQGETIRNPLPAGYLGLIGCLDALVMASEAGAGELFPSRIVAAGNGPASVADLDGDTVPDLVIANDLSLEKIKHLTLERGNK